MKLAHAWISSFGAAQGEQKGEKQSKQFFHFPSVRVAVEKPPALIYICSNKKTATKYKKNGTCTEDIYTHTCRLYASVCVCAWP